MVITQMSASPLVTKLQHSASKGAIVAAAGTAVSLLIGGGTQGVKVFAVEVPKFAVIGGSLFATSVASVFIVPNITPFASVGNPALRKFENLVLVPTMVGLGLVIVDSVLSPETVKSEGGNLFKQVSVGFGASVLGGYLSEGLGLQPTVLA